MIKHSMPWITDADRSAVDRQLTSGMIAGIEVVRQFEAATAASIGGDAGVATVSGTAAILLALKALGVGADAEVVLPSYVCPSVMQAVITAGATPVLCDIGPSWNATPETIERCTTARTRAVIAVNMFGISAELDVLADAPFAVIEDHCQSFGLRRSLFGSAAVCSFYATKCLTTGEGGAAVFRDGRTAQRARELRQTNAVPGVISDLQAALGLSQLARYPEMLERRRRIAERYLRELPDHMTRGIAQVADRSMFYRFPLTVDADYDLVAGRFEQHGVIVGRAVALLLHRLLGMDDSGFPNTVKTYDSTVSIPIYPAMSDDDVGRVIRAVHRVASTL